MLIRHNRNDEVALSKIIESTQIEDVVRELIIGASCARAKVFGATESLQACGMEEKKDNFLAGTPGLLSVRRYLVDGWQVLIF